VLAQTAWGSCSRLGEPRKARVLVISCCIPANPSPTPQKRRSRAASQGRHLSRALSIHRCPTVFISRSGLRSCAKDDDRFRVPPVMPVANNPAPIDQAARLDRRTSANLSGSPYTTFPNPFGQGANNRTTQESRATQDPRTMSYARTQHGEGEASSPARLARADRNGAPPINRAASGQRFSQPALREVNGTNGTHHARRGSDSLAQIGRRPSSAPGKKQGLAVTFANGNGASGSVSGGESDDDDESISNRLVPTKPPMLRSKSDYAKRMNDGESAGGERFPWDTWGARHGFEGHYQSEEMMSQLANVSPVVVSIALHCPLPTVILCAGLLHRRPTLKCPHRRSFP
jgi:hypothetical protein